MELFVRLGSLFRFVISIRGIAGDKKGTAFVVYEDIFDAKNAFDHLSGFNVAGRYVKYILISN